MKTYNDNILVSIGIPFYNTEKYLKLAILSVLKQSYTNWELILMNDGSTDNSVAIAEEFANSDSRITLHNDGVNKGLPTRLNQLSQLANGQFYARMDGDDLMRPERIETQLEYLLKNPEVDLVGTGLVAIDKDNNIIGIRKGTTNDNKKYTIHDLIHKGWCVHPTIMGKASWFKEHQYDEQLTRTEDFDLWVRTIGQSTFTKMQYLGIYYREESALSLKKYIVSTKQALRLYWKNKSIIGGINTFIISVKKVLKFLVYIVFNYTGLMPIIVKKRSEEMKATDINFHQSIIKSIISDNTNS
ncbi:glycosyltransferase family 2 protein [Algibacter miyuki]|uniref:Glycosyltransferase family 2 protein n=1 Tax=Algibacter miyuki TaxID=1306933 RepID=A0ABV5GYE7_9FLAO|nr:glycosyltransferase family 2 protein [Algibacter miyuki]MDN3667154.1 glycosyltransferase family 2 protein [Algibacter miyuki]